MERAEKKGDGRREEDGGGEKKKNEGKGRAEAALSTRPGLHWDLQVAAGVRSPCLSHLSVFHGDSTLAMPLANFRELKNEEKKEKETAEQPIRMQTAGRVRVGGSGRVFMELILGRILLRSSNMKHNETSKHFASVYGRSFHPGCKNICEFL